MAKKPGVQIELIPSMYDLGMFKKTLSSRKRLRLTAFGAVLALCFVYLGFGLLIRHVSVWEWLNTILILVLIICSGCVAYVVALAIGDAVFQGPWREKMIRGGKYVPDSLEDQKALLKNRSIVFLLVWAVSIAVLGFGCDFVTGGNIRWYTNIGSTVIAMRSPDVENRRFIVRMISNAYYSSRWSDEGVREALCGLLRDEDPEVLEWSAYVAGRAKLVEGTDELIAIAKDRDAGPAVRREAVIALGRMEWKPARAALFSVMKAAFAADRGDRELVPAVLYAFYMMKDGMAAPEAIQMMKTCLVSGDCSLEVLQYGFFYLKSLRVKEAASLSFSYLDTPGITPEMRCYASDILRFTASKADVPRLKAEFRRAQPGVECPVVYRKYHGEPAVILFERDMLRALFVRSVGNMMDPADFDWIWMIGSDTAEDLQTRKVAETYTRAMQERGIVR